LELLRKIKHLETDGWRWKK